MADSAAPAATPAPAPQLDEVMLAMDVVDTLRHQEKLVERELGQGERDETLKARLRRIYEGQGLEVSDRILDQGIRALKESRFVYTPPKPGFDTFMARLWVRRRPVGLTLGILLVVLALFVGWQISRSNQTAREAELQQIELTETLPAALAAAGEATLAASDDADATAWAEALIADGEVAAGAQDGAAMREVTAALEDLRGELVRTYTLTIVSREGEDTGVFREPDVNEDARNYYIIVEAIDDSGNALSLPVVNEEDSRTETVSMWGIRVPERTFETVRADKGDDGIVQDNVLGLKERGTLKVDYLMDVRDGAITQW
ncbi:MAG: hypothetical protein GY798_09075 [Hyphomicrobiales bacterium]|nr:hypothetical protein [Hyphomicrobiales bacterium]